MPREICQAEKVAQAKIRSLCETCLSSPSCQERVAYGLAARTANSGECKRFFVGECDGYKPREDMPPFRASLYPNMLRAGIEHLCAQCPVDESRTCGFGNTLDEIRTVARRNGKHVLTTVACCSSSPEKLYQIGEPSQK